MAWVALNRLLAAPLPGRTCAADPGLTHDHFLAQSLAVAAALQARAVQRAGLWFEDAAQLAIALYACWRAGTVAVLPGSAHPSACASLDSGLDLWITDAADLPVPSQRQTTLSALHDTAPLAPAELDLDAAGIVLCTSGSSGQPKQITKRWRQLAAEIEALEQQWRWTDSPACVLGSVSPQHMYGLPFRVLWPLCAGRTIGRRQLVYPEDLQRASLEQPACAWIASPALLKRLGERMQWHKLASRLRQVYSSGGPLLADVADRLEAALGCRPIEIYGSSETGAAAWRQDAGTWRPLPSVRVGVNDEGALWVRSPWLADAVEQTADAAEAEADGFRLLGRLDRIIKLEEKRIALPALEDNLARHPYVLEARLGQAAPARRLTALVALAPAGIHALRNQGRKAVVRALDRHMAAHTDPLGVPRRWRFMRELPWTEQGKLPAHVFEAATVRPTLPRILPPGAAGEPTDAQERRFLLDIPLDLLQLDGHFPTAPVVPGIAQIQWALALAQHHLVPALTFHGMEVLKFQRLIRPGDTVDLTLRWEAEKTRLHFSYRQDGQPCSSGRILAQPSSRAVAAP